MTDRNASARAECDRRIAAHENQVDEDLNALRQLDERWATFRQVMRENVDRFEESGHAVGTENYGVQHDLAALRELGAYAERLAREQSELSGEASRAIRIDGEAEIERLRDERSRLPWD